MAALAALRSSAMLVLCESEAAMARKAVVLQGLRCRAAEMALQAVATLAEEGLLPTVSLVLDRTWDLRLCQAPSLVCGLGFSEGGSGPASPAWLAAGGGLALLHLLSLHRSSLRL
ncbi:unnamed protein product [Durusdinium trenchii]|uniref:Uncharacterized protein n=1 Tax=Durusdinium trenchii TaxID=1381693 RepID=A0ABP0K334_9DINO